MGSSEMQLLTSGKEVARRISIASTKRARRHIHIVCVCVWPTKSVWKRNTANSCREVMAAVGTWLPLKIGWLAKAQLLCSDCCARGYSTSCCCISVADASWHKPCLSMITRSLVSGRWFWDMINKAAVFFTTKVVVTLKTFLGFDDSCPFSANFALLYMVLFTEQAS